MGHLSRERKGRAGERLGSFAAEPVFRSATGNSGPARSVSAFSPGRQTSGMTASSRSATPCSVRRTKCTPTIRIHARCVLPQQLQRHFHVPSKLPVAIVPLWIGAVKPPAATAQGTARPPARRRPAAPATVSPSTSARCGGARPPGPSRDWRRRARRDVCERGFRQPDRFERGEASRIAHSGLGDAGCQCYHSFASPVS